jgi:hypothetical protein
MKPGSADHIGNRSIVQRTLNSLVRSSMIERAGHDPLCTIDATDGPGRLEDSTPAGFGSSAVRQNELAPSGMAPRELSALTRTCSRGKGKAPSAL